MGFRYNLCEDCVGVCVCSDPDGLLFKEGGGLGHFQEHRQEIDFRGFKDGFRDQGGRLRDVFIIQTEGLSMPVRIMWMF